MAAEPLAAPVAPEDRVEALDVLRGFALLGILLANIRWFGLPYDAVRGGLDTTPTWADAATRYAIDLLIVGKFNAIFSFLFGVGFTIFIDRAVARGAPYARLHLRRMAGLFVIGAAHFFLVWDGEILHKYALLGVLLLPLRRAPAWLLATLFILALAAPLTYRYTLGQTEPRPRSYYEERAREQTRVYSEGPYADQVRERARFAYDRYVAERAGWWELATYGATMLLGLYAGRRRIFHDIPAHRRLLWHVFGWGLALGLACAAVFAIGMRLLEGTGVGPLRIAAGVAFTLNRPLLGMAYVAGVALLCDRAGPGAAWLAPLRAVGRMPLTNYLMQSVIATAIFYSYGLALFGQVGYALGALLAVAIYATQVVYGSWWMGRFRFGPVEWLWRAATYGRLRPAGPRCNRRRWENAESVRR